MKNKLINKFPLLLVLVLIMACSEEKPIPSDITYYPDFEITGGENFFVELGDTFTDPGVIASSGDATLPVTSSGTVDTNTPGVYVINYTATNSDGFDGSASRNVIVVDDMAAVAANDLSGDYTVSDWSGRPSSVTKIADGIYQVEDIIPYNGLSVVMYQVSSSKLVIPSFSSPFGTVYADSDLYPGTSGTITADGFTLNTYISCCGVFSSIFVKN